MEIAKLDAEITDLETKKIFDMGKILTLFKKLNIKNKQS